ncbi:hypothetical protein EZ428_21550 [Pedobacter frigiditerrae]|uniref:Outer membrane protein beta-barrel family protein n=1 Tax=Pedobacter frigiditerrae TaxID=2530452 RepID=A0A4R0MKY4_9SPHI|nr:hypothetical protein [Pedobacter frigiditerrae]TCC87290.1 hypothetical protein EZ428_21550 [Pedobacter frigiditerrae]
MMAIQKTMLALGVLLLFGSATFAQVKKPVVNVDSVKKQLKNAVKIDSNKIKELAHIDKKVKKTVNDKINQSAFAKILKKDSTAVGKKVQLKNVSIENTVQYGENLGLISGSNYLNRISFDGQLEVYKIPINLALVNNYNPLNQLNFSQQNLFKVDLAKQQLQQLYQVDLQKYKNLKSKKFLSMTAQNYLKKGIREKIQEGLPEQITNNQKVMAYLNNPNSIKELLSMSKEQVEAKLSSVMNELKEEAKNKGEEFYNSKKDSLTQVFNTKVQEVSAYVQSVKQELSDNGLDEEKIELLEKFVNNKISERDLEALFISQLSNQPELQKLQKAYSKIKEFQAGNFANLLPGSFMNRDLFLNGVNLAVRTARGPVTVGIATNKDLGQPKDMEYTRSNFSSPKLYTYLSVPTTNFAFGSGKLSWVGLYDKQYQNTSTLLSTAVPRNNMVFTISQNLNLNDFGKLTVDVSKSAVQYNNLVNGPELVLADQLTKGNYFKDDLFETMSFGLNHGLDSRKMGLKSNVYFSYSGIGFQNPGQQGNTNMNMRFGGNVKKSMFNNRVTFYLRTDMKNTPISASNNSHWRNYNVQLDSRIRLSKSYTLSLKYLENGVNKVGVEQALPVYASKKLQTDFNANYKIFGKSSFSHLSLAKQDMDNQGSATMVATNFIQANYAQTVVFKSFSLNGNVFYNKQLTANPILGDMINSDMACQYTLFKSVFLSSGVTYLNNQRIAEQVGIRQNIQTMVKKHLEVSAYLDVRKNLITPLYPDLFSKARAEFSLKYYLDKQ